MRAADSRAADWRSNDNGRGTADPSTSYAIDVTRRAPTEPTGAPRFRAGRIETKACGGVAGVDFGSLAADGALDTDFRSARRGVSGAGVCPPESTVWAWIRVETSEVPMFALRCFENPGAAVCGCCVADAVARNLPPSSTYTNVRTLGLFSRAVWVQRR